MQTRIGIAAAGVVVLGGGALLAWSLLGRQGTDARDTILLYGNVDLRQVDLAFHGSERIARLVAEEGDRVEPGELLAELESDRLEHELGEARARVEAAHQVLARLEAGTRPEEVAQARAEVTAARAELHAATLRHERLKDLVGTGATRQQDVDDAEAGARSAEAALEVKRKALELALAGPRVEEIEEARARLKAETERVGLLEVVLADTRLHAPAAGTIYSRLAEPGEMVSPQQPVYSLAVHDPKWVRAYVPESDLGRLRLGMKARVTTDSFPGKGYKGWIGFLSPEAEFTPKSVETTELRTSLVYRVRVFVRDPGDELRLGMPATVAVDLTPDDEGRRDGER